MSAKGYGDDVGPRGYSYPKGGHRPAGKAEVFTLEQLKAQLEGQPPPPEPKVDWGEDDEVSP